jgi:hypothetical protein
MKQTLPVILALTLFFSCTSKKDSSLADRKEKINELESAPCSQEQLERKSRSMEYCKNYGIPTIDFLPCIENEVAIRTKDEIVARALALCFLGLKSEGLEREHLEEFDKKYQVSQYFTENEKLYVLSDAPTDQQVTDANWRYESLHVLLWALGYKDSLKYAGEVCNVAEDVKIIFAKTRDEFSNQSKLRSKEEILDQADLIYRIHWACVDARTKNQAAPAKLDASVVYERHHVLNWLISYMNQHWDDVSTDT